MFHKAKSEGEIRGREKEICAKCTKLNEKLQLHLAPSSCLSASQQLSFNTTQHNSAQVCDSASCLPRSPLSLSFGSNHTRAAASAPSSQKVLLAPAPDCSSGSSLQVGAEVVLVCARERGRFKRIKRQGERERGYDSRQSPTFVTWDYGSSLSRLVQRL